MIKIYKGDQIFPSQLTNIQNPVDKLYYQGDKNLLSKKFVAIVGARNVLPWVEQWMEYELIPALRSCDLGVISGGARGVDQRAHSCALRAGVPTLAVLPSGLNCKYPRTVEALLGSSPLSGFLSEYEPNESMRKHYFYSRNRIIAGFSPLVLVVQASEKSGSMITAKYALEYGKSIATIPATPMDPSTSGNLRLLYDGSYFVRNSGDLKSLFYNYFNSNSCEERIGPQVGEL